ncbi:hypothetical protein [Algoriphagus aquimarinus]|uniref:Arylsulfotransferase (ASST) n=1 Tax=Algoriphagus aquimarinus TaxID=237018 RepID=A0A5C7AXB9_9BACT|nr:hypothetical protein [Algoriphagus aquimarinus]TXE13410.1 hypothetical protein ESV85_05400 [Algoriphagus aquimarinus]
MISRSLITKIFVICIVQITAVESFVLAQQATDSEVASKIDLSRHDFLYAGEAKVQDMYIVKDGKVVWEHKGPRVEEYLGEISDAVMMTNGNILFAHQYGITLINQKDETLWNYKAPANTEIHTAQPIGKKHIIYVQNGNPAKVNVMNIETNKIVHSFIVPVKNPDNTHGHFRHARLTKNGTYLLAHMDLGKVAEYDFDGNEVWSINAPGVWSAEPLKNGNVLLCGSDRWIREVNKNKEVVWDFKLDDHPQYKMTSPQIATRLDNGNTIINTWFSQWGDKLDLKNPPIQVIEVTPRKEVVWVLQSWEDPYLGPSTTIQVLGDKRISEHAHFGNIK